MDRTTGQLLSGCFPRLMAGLLPWLALDNAGILNHTKARRFLTLLKQDDWIGNQGVDHLMMMYLPEIIVELLGTLGGREEDGTDGENLGNDYDFTSELDPTFHRPSFSPRMLRSSLAYLASCLGQEGSIIKTLTHRPDIIQRIMLGQLQLVESLQDSERLRALRSYALFVLELLPNLPALSGSTPGDLGSFVLRDIVYSLVHFLRSDQSR
uniref:Uncharacterized protein n=1 Tax=Eptatretus burgeri TaxID=7764 RepID=A0A8C4WWQ5_EPTBU